ncbi:SUMF1/EgtB/PvdO family nonheme iron enzyme [candidate division KSB1 bacterium]|nr:SUMF1/EgtB/PvdO family nonheme iron enzyme [candidate division KSB1 bacterium]
MNTSRLGFKHKISLIGSLVSLICITSLSFSQDTRTNTKRTDKSTDAEWVLIKGQEFSMGHAGKGDHAPVHKVLVSDFYIEKTEVTNAMYYQFCQETGHRLPEFWEMDPFRSGIDYPDHPVTGISWFDAKKYAKWRGGRLPTEAEWEYAARGGLIGKNFPNGDQLDENDANTGRSKHKGTVRVGSFPPNGYGLYDMAGNVVEWVADRYSESYYAQSVYDNPKGPPSGRFRIIRGGGWHSGPSCNRVYYRNALPPNWVDFNVGFRCVKDYSRTRTK